MDEPTALATRAVWTTAYVNDLSDASFLFIESGGDKDEDGKTVPRSLRHFPYKDASGAVDLPHLRNAIARIPQSNAPGLDKEALQARARRLLEDAQGEKAGRRMSMAWIEKLTDAVGKLSSVLSWAQYDDGESKDEGDGTKAKELSFEQRRQLVQAALTDRFPRDGEAEPVAVPYVWVIDLYSDKAIYEWKGRKYSLPYAFDDGGAVVLGVPVEVVSSYTPVAALPSMKAGTFTVIKAADGTVRWLTLSSNGFRDREDEIVSTKALEGAVTAGDAGGDRGPLRIFHVPGTDIGTCDFQAVQGRFLVESGTFDATPQGEAARAYFLAAEEPMAVSIGFRYPETAFDGKVYSRIQIMERSICPAKAAANPWTSFTAVPKGDPMDDQKKAFLETVFAGSPGLVERMLAAADAATKDLEGSVAFKASDAATKMRGLIGKIADAELKAAMMDAMDEMMPPEKKKAEGEGDDAPPAPSVSAAEIAEALVTALGPLNEALEAVAKTVTDLKAADAAFDGRMKAIEASDEEKIAAKITPRGAGFRATASDDNKVDNDAAKAIVEKLNGGKEGEGSAIAPYIADLIKGVPR